MLAMETVQCLCTNKTRTGSINSQGECFAASREAQLRNDKSTIVLSTEPEYSTEFFDNLRAYCHAGIVIRFSTTDHSLLTQNNSSNSRVVERGKGRGVAAYAPGEEDDFVFGKAESVRGVLHDGVDGVLLLRRERGAAAAGESRVVPTQNAVIRLDGRAHATDLVEAGVALGANDEILAVVAIGTRSDDGTIPPIYKHRVDVVSITSPHLRTPT